MPALDVLLLSLVLFDDVAYFVMGLFDNVVVDLYELLPSNEAKIVFQFL